MIQSVLDIQLHQLIDAEFSGDFVEFCQLVVPKYPVAESL